MDRFNLQIKIASTELEIQKLEEAKNNLEGQIANKLATLASFRLRLARGVYMTTDDSDQAESVEPADISLDDKVAAIREYLLAASYKQTDRIFGSSCTTEFWQKDEHHKLVLVIHSEPVPGVDLYLSSKMVPVNSLP